MELRLEEVEAREMKSPEKLGKFDFVLIGIGSDKKRNEYGTYGMANVQIKIGRNSN